MTSQALEREVARYRALGYQLVEQTDLSAQLIKATRFSVLGFISWAIVGLGGGAPVDASGSRKPCDRFVSLSVDPDGNVETTTI
jgi:hypothetical protein